MDRIAGVRVLKQDYHRNGVGGIGFVVSLVEWPEGAKEARGYGSHSGLFLAISFFSEDKHDMGALQAQTAVMNIGQVAEGQILMDENAAWRGADYVGPAVVAAWEAHKPWEHTNDRND